MVASTGEKCTKQEIDQALAYCIENNQTRAADFEPVLLFLMQRALDPSISYKEVLHLQNSKYKSSIWSHE